MFVSHCWSLTGRLFHSCIPATAKFLSPVFCMFCRRMSAEAEDSLEQHKVELAGEQRSAGLQRTLWEADVMAHTEGKDGFVVGSCRLWVTSAQQSATSDPGNSSLLCMYANVCYFFTKFISIGGLFSATLIKIMENIIFGVLLAVVIVKRVRLVTSFNEDIDTAVWIHIVYFTLFTVKWLTGLELMVLNV